MIITTFCKFEGKGTELHRKMGIMIREKLDRISNIPVISHWKGNKGNEWPCHARQMFYLDFRINYCSFWYI